jgi:phosphohistidine phosphatase
VELYILRHGDAPYKTLSRERVLSEAGKAETAQVVTARATELSAVPLIVCSPVRRARETLAVVEQTLSNRPQVLFDDCLRSESSVQQVETFVDSLQADKLLLISHQPLVGHILNYLTDSSGSASGFATSSAFGGGMGMSMSMSMGMAMGTSCLASLDLITFARGCGTLNWLDSPQ